MKAKTFRSRLCLSLVAAIIAASRFSAMATTVYGTDLDIGNGNNFTPGLGSSIAGGGANTVIPEISTIGGGTNNCIGTNSPFSFIGGGQSNSIDTNSPYGVIGGGQTNYIGSNSPYSFIGGGFLNTAVDDSCVIGGGNANFLGAEASFIGGGQTNTSYGEYSVIAGGDFNYITTNVNGPFIGGGAFNTNNGSWCAIVGGARNSIGLGIAATSTSEAFIGGGEYNTIVGTATLPSQSAIVGGLSNTNSGGCGFIGAGSLNYIEAGHSVIGGGLGNSIYGFAGNTHGSIIGGGALNVISNFVSAVSIGGGIGNFGGATGVTIPGGQYASATNYGQQAYASGAFANSGDAQTSTYVVRNTTTSATQTELYLDGSGALMQLPDNTTWTFDILVTGRSSTGGNSGSWQILGCIEKTSGTTSIVGGVSVTSIAQTVPTWSVTADADNTDGALVVNVTGDTSTIRWVATVRTAEVTN